MNITEAIKSGRPFVRELWGMAGRTSTQYYTIDEAGRYVGLDGYVLMTVGKSDLLADDFVLKPEPREGYMKPSWLFTQGNTHPQAFAVISNSSAYVKVREVL